MRIDRLDLIAYGPFTGSSLDLSAGREGLHILYGPNEAGKSSTLRAILHFLYGIPVQKADNFLHPNANLRIGGTLRNRDGKLHAIRRKGNNQTLRAADDKTPIDDAALKRFLPVDTQSQFELMFGINHERLLEGGRELLAGKGEVGSMLFAASSGITNLPAVSSDLESASRELYTARSRTTRIAVALGEMKKAEDRQHDAQTTPADYKKLLEELKDLREGLAAISTELRTKRQEQERLTRLQKALPWLTKRRDYQALLAPVSDAILLDQDFGLRAQRAQTELRQAQAAADSALSRQQALEEEAKLLPVDAAILAQTDNVKQLYEGLGTLREYLQDRPRQEGKLATALSEVRHLLSELGRDCLIEEIGRLALSELARRRIHGLSNTRGELDQVYKLAWSQVQQSQRKIKDAEHELKSLPPARDPAALQRALTRSLQEGPLEKTAAQLRQDVTRESEALEREARGLALWRGGIADLEAAAIPLAATVQRYETRLQSFEQRQQQLALKLTATSEAAAKIDADLQAGSHTQDVPTEGDLEQARLDRHQRWTAIRDGAVALAVAAAPYESDVTRADTIADRLRREANRVTEKARLLAEREQLSNQRQQLDAAKQTLDQEQAAHLEDWRQQWPDDVSPGPPREMLAWMQQRAALVTRWNSNRAKLVELEGLHATIRARREELGHTLRALQEPDAAGGETLQALQDRARAVIEQLADEAHRRNEAQTQINWVAEELVGQQNRMRQAQSGLENWRQEWAAAIEPLGANELTPDEARLQMELLQRLGEKKQQIDDLQQRIQGIQEREQDYTRRAQSLAKDLLPPELAQAPVEQVVATLNSRLQQARQNRALLDQNKKAQQQHRHDYDEAQKAIRESEAQLAVLCELAQCPEPAGLMAAAEQSQRRRQWEQAVRDAEGHLADYSNGDLAALEHEAAATNSDELAGRLAQLAAEIEQQQQRERMLDKDLIEKEQVEKQIGREGFASQAAQDYEAQHAALEQHVDEYLRLRLASLVLQASIKRYREKNQGPVLTRASQLFSLLTSGKFSELRLEWDDRQEATLVGVRAKKEELVHVEGMSEGTRDQLYLALRLASLENYCDTHEPAPFIVDDILINFDDRRAVDTLKALADLSRRTQVLLFTHHEHLLELATKALPADVLFTHHL